MSTLIEKIKIQLGEEEKKLADNIDVTKMPDDTVKNLEEKNIISFSVEDDKHDQKNQQNT